MGDVFYVNTVTVFNKVTTKNSLGANERWFPTVIHNVRLLVSRGTNIMKSGLEAADSARLHIDDELSSSDKPFKVRAEWDSLADAQKEEFWTLDSDKGSFFIEGDHSGEEVTSNFFEAMKKKYNNVFRISSVDRFGLIPHWEVWGK